MKALSIRYKLKQKSKIIAERNKPELVLAEISGAFAEKINGVIKYKKFQFSLETLISPKYFGIIREKRGVINYVYDEETIKENKKYNKALRLKIDDFEASVDSANAHFKNQEPTIAEVKNFFLINSGRNKRRPIENFEVIKFLNDHIKHLESLIDSGRKDEVKNSTINSYRNLIPILKRYEEASKNKLIFENLDERRYREIWNTVNEIRTGKIRIEGYQKKLAKPFATNTLKAYQTYFILLCKKAKKDNINVSLDLTDTNLINSASNNKSKKTEAYLKEDDLLKISNYVPKTDNLRLARNYILVASQTGMRLQSMKEASGRKIQEYTEFGHPFYFLHTFQEKTKTECFTPLFSTALNIIKENGNLFPDFCSIALTNLNINIRKVLKFSGIENSYLYSTHNLRSSFVTNLILLRISEKIISSITHPGKKNTSSSMHVYERTDMIDKAKMFVEEIRLKQTAKKSKFYMFD